jgi:hypothetical protein
MLRLLDSKNTPLFPQRVPRRGNSFAFSLPTLGSLRFMALCLPFSGRNFTPALRPRGHTPLESPLICVRKAGHKSIKRGSVSGFALLSYGEEPCPLLLQTVFLPISLRRIGKLISLGQNLCVFDAPSLIYITCFHHFSGDASYSN